MGFYRDFNRKNIDLGSLGVRRLGEKVKYFCTPRGAAVIGMADSDGVHYCFIKEFDETVFVVSPENQPGEYVHVLAKDFKDFLRLLVSVGNSTALEKAWCVGRTEFDELCEKPGEYILEELEALGIKPIDDPFEYIRSLQRSFDMSSLKFPAGCPMPPEANDNVGWQVFFGRGFNENGGRSRPCREMRIDKSFKWDGNDWMVLSAYISLTGIVVDLLEPNDIGHYDPTLIANGFVLSPKSSLTVKLDKNNNDPGANAAAEHYRLDRECGKTVHRWNFLWQRRRTPDIRVLNLQIEREKSDVPEIEISLK